MKAISRILPLILLFSFTLYAQGVNPNCEKGDAVFRDLWFFFFNVGHSAIYLNSDSKFAKKGQPDNYNKTDPRTAPLLNSDLKHSVIQANGTQPGDSRRMLPLTARTFEGFLNGQKYWGAFNGVPGGLTYKKRNWVVYYAWLQIGCDYAFYPWPAIKLPSLYRDDGKRVFIGSFRCDGIVEYVYEQIRIHKERSDNPNDWGFFTEEEEKKCISTFYPHALFTRMYEEQGREFPVYSPPQIKEITLKDTAGNPIEPDEDGVYRVSGRITIEANISDGDYGSGVDRMVVLVENDVGDTFYLNGEEYVEGDAEIPEESVDDHDEDIEGIYTVEWNTTITDTETGDLLFPPGYYILHILAFDQAGNVEVEEETIKVYKKNPEIEFDFPCGIAYDPTTGYIYVADTYNHRIVKTKIDGTGWTTFGSYGSEVGEFKHPRGIAYDPTTGYIYVADFDNYRIVKTKIDGTGWTTLRGFGRVGGVDYDATTGYIYVVDYDNKCIVKTKIDGTGWTTLGGFYAPWGICYDATTGYIYVADMGNKRIVKTKIDGSGWTILEDPSWRPYGVDYDVTTGYIYVSDGGNRIIKTKIDGSSKITLVGFYNPYDIDYDPATGYIYVADTRNYRIVKTKIDGTGWQTLP